MSFSTDKTCLIVTKYISEFGVTHVVMIFVLSSGTGVPDLTPVKEYWSCKSQPPPVRLLGPQTRDLMISSYLSPFPPSLTIRLTYIFFPLSSGEGYVLLRTRIRPV